jgi:tetratricopeptide (TPR) repeat protein
LNPHNANAEFLLGQTLLKLNKTNEAVAALKKTVEVDPSYSQAYYSLFRALAKSNPEEAEFYQKQFKSLQKSDQNTDRAMTLSNSALQSEQSGDSKSAVAKLEEAIHVCGHCGSLALLHKNLGLIECRAGRLDDGEKELRVALESLPKDAEILQSLEAVRQLRQRPAAP